MRVLNNGSSFKGLPIGKQQLVNELIENHQKAQVTRVLGQPDTLDDVKRRSSRLIPMIVNNYKTDKPVDDRVRDALGMRDMAPVSSQFPGGISNSNSQSGVYGQDPALANHVVPNIWISPMEAAAIYSQKGLPEIIIRKKSQSVLINGVKIKCKLFTAEQHEKVAMSMQKIGLAQHIAEVISMSLIHGGGLLYPVFKRDSPASMGMPIGMLAKYGILGKDCIDYMVPLDRWNVVHIPNWNPTAKDFLMPKEYYIPYLGADVNGQRCARIVTAPQSGFWGNIMTLGWGISDIPGWIEPIYNYYNVMQAIPTMINQMSIMVRTFNIEGLLATEGTDVFDAIDRNETLRIRQTSVNNPINMDVIGDLQAIKRDFQKVPELVRLIRQDAAARATIPEELLWSSERGAFSSGDSTDSAYEKQSEGTRYIHIDVANQLKPIAQLAVINALGLDRDVLKALPYVTIEFDNPRITNSKDKAEVSGKITKGMFDMVAAGLPMDGAIDISRQFSDDEFVVSPELMDQLRERQATKDAREAEKHEKEMELLDAQIEAARMHAAVPGGAKPKSGDDKEKKGHSYGDRLEQKKHEKVGEGSKQGIAKARAKEQ
jgi:hypothetical protein